MKILAAPGDTGGSGYYRILSPYSALKAKGYDVTFTSQTNDPRITSTDVLVLQRQRDLPIVNLVNAVRQHWGHRIVYEFDDSFHTVPKHNPNGEVLGSGKPATKIVERLMQMADVLTVPTPDLRGEYLRFNPNIVVLPNALPDRYVDMYDTEITGAPKREGQIRIGWAGSNSHGYDLWSIMPALTKVMEAHPETLFVSLGDDFRPLFPAHLKKRVECAGGTATKRGLDLNHIDERLLGTPQYYDLIKSADFDIAIAPLEHTTFNRCRSELKLMEYGMLGIPAVAERFGPYVRYRAGMVAPSALFASDTAEWCAALTALVRSPEKRAALATANRAYVKRDHVLSKHLPQWEQMLADLPPIRKAVA